MFKDMLSLLHSRSYKLNKIKNMPQDKLFNVKLTLGYDTVLGIVKAEDMASAMEFLRKEYPTHHVDSIEESVRTIL